MEQILVDKIGTVSVTNGLVRIQCQASGADGELRTSGEMVVPASQFGPLIGALQQVGKQLQEKLAESRQADSGAASGEGQ